MSRPTNVAPVLVAPRPATAGGGAGLGLALLAAVVLAAAPARADEPKPVWDLKLGLSYVATGGNSRTSTAGGNVDYTHRFSLWELSAFATAVSAARDGSATAERYAAGARAAYPLTARLSLVGGVKGEKDRFAGIDLRGVADAGVEWKLIATDLTSASVIGGLSWTHRKPIVGSTDSVFGGLVGVRASAKLSPTAEATGAATFYPSFETADDWRGDAALGVQATITGLLSLKVGWELRYENQPVPGFGKTDTVTLVSLVLSTASTAAR